MAPKRSRSDVSEDSVSRKRGRSARRRGSTTMTSAYVNGTSGGGNTGNTCHGRRRGRPRGAGRGRTLNDRCSAASTVTSGSAFGFSHQDSSSDSDTGPMSHRLESTDSDAGSTSDLDEPANTNEMKPDEELANNEPTITDKLMSAVNGALPALRGELAAHARSVLAARAHPLANMLRTLARFTTTVIPNRKRLGLSKSKGTMVKKRAINKCTMKEADINSPELSYLWTPSLNQRFPKSDETLVSTMSGFDGPSTSKFNPMFKDLTPTSPTYKNSRIPDPTNVAQSPTSPIYEDPTSDSNIDPKRQNESPTTPTKNDLTEPTNRNPPIHETTRKSTSLSNRDPRLQKNRPATLINIDLTQTSREPSEGEMKLDLKLLSNKDPRLQKKSLTTPINIDLTQTSWDLKPQMNHTTPQQKYYDLTQMDQSPKNEDPTSQTNCESKPNITEEISLQNSNSSLNMNGVKQDGDVKQNGDIKPSVNEDPSLMDWDPTLDLTLDDDDEDVDTMLRKINKITSFHERTLLNDTQDLDLFPEISLPKKTNAFDILMKTEPSGSRRRGSSCGSVKPRGAARAPRAPRERPEDWDPMTEDPLSQSESLSATRSMPRFSGVSLMSGDGEQDEGDVEMGVAETYADYTPAKLNFGLGHPDPVVETASLSSVETADITYQLSLPDETIRSGLLSALQLEAVVYASQAHEQLLADGTRAGFLIGDGAGVGKGRTIAGIIFENYLKGRKRAVWVSVSNDLKYDAERDLRDIGAGNTIKVHPLNKMKYCSISSGVNGSVSEGVVFSTYSSLIGYTTAADAEFNSRLKQLLAWCTPDFDGCVSFNSLTRLITYV